MEHEIRMQKHVRRTDYQVWCPICLSAIGQASVQIYACCGNLGFC